MYVATFESTKTEANVFRLEGAAVFFFWKYGKKVKKRQRAQDLRSHTEELGVIALLRAWRVVFFFACCKVHHINFFLG